MALSLQLDRDDASDASIILQFRDDDTSIRWRFQGTEREYELMKYEVGLYNGWIALLISGEAPASSYANEYDADAILIARNRKYQQLFDRPENRGYYERISMEFNVKMGGETDVEGFEDDDFDDDDFDYEPDARELQSILLDPLSEKSSLGYRIFPMTHRLISRGVF